MLRCHSSERVAHRLGEEGGWPVRPSIHFDSRTPRIDAPSCVWWSTKLAAAASEVASRSLIELRLAHVPIDGERRRDKDEEDDGDADDGLRPAPAAADAEAARLRRNQRSRRRADDEGGEKRGEARVVGRRSAEDRERKRGPRQRCPRPEDHVPIDAPKDEGADHAAHQRRRPTMTTTVVGHRPKRSAKSRSGPRYARLAGLAT